MKNMTYSRGVFIFVVLALALVFLRVHNYSSPSQRQQPSQVQLPSPSRANSLWVVVDKGRVLPDSYVPAGLVQPQVPIRDGLADEKLLRADAAAALGRMFAAAQKANLRLMLASGYRSFATQQQLYNSYVRSSGAIDADKYSAHPGYSEHQTGLAADVEPVSGSCEVQDCFGDTPEGRWLASNSSRYGFVIRYKNDNQNLTGYSYEPWHVRYVGATLATKLTLANQTLEQYFKLSAVTDYSSMPFHLD